MIEVNEFPVRHAVSYRMFQEEQTLTPNMFSGLEVARFELRLRALESASLPPFLGSTIRGAFGHALKQTVCVMPHRDCDRCLVADRCIYPYLFETPAPSGLPHLRGQERAPHPFILSHPVPGAAIATRAAASVAPSLAVAVGVKSAELIPLSDKTPGTLPVAQSSSRRECTASGPIQICNEPRTASSGGHRLHINAGDYIAFGLGLMGRAIEYLPYLVYAVIEMSRRGLGADRVRFELTDVLRIEANGEKQRIYSGDSHRFTTPAGASMSLSDLVRARLEALRSNAGFRDDLLKLRFVTPTRIRVDGDLQAGMSFELLVRNLLRRVSLLCAVHGRAPLELDYRGLIERARSVNTLSSELHWCDWERYSNRQQTKMKLGGFKGQIEYGGEILSEFLSLIVAGEFLHVGAGTSFGLGCYEIAK